jgi:RNA polymerase sigma-54 factor
MLLTLKKSDYLIGEYLIDSIEPEGRLDPEIDYDDIKLLVFESFKEKISDHDIERVLHKIQELEPEGCGYRSITESLTIQIRNLDIEQELILSTTKAVNNISQHKTTIDKLDKEIQEIIKSLSYHPGLAIESESAFYTKPDLVAIKKNSDWLVSLNDSYMPKAVLENMNGKLKSMDSDKKVEIKSFLNGLERRQQTLLLVSEYLLKKQEDFLNKQTYPLPITLLEIGDALELSESTISRVVQSKYIQLPDKLISLNSLLERRVNAKSEGRDISPRELERLLVKLTSEEDKQVPHTDESLRYILKESYSVDIARRTISKYREGINIPIARFRKKE